MTRSYCAKASVDKAACCGGAACCRGGRCNRRVLGRSGRFPAPVGNERGRHHQQTGGLVRFLDAQKRQQLNGFAQAHVVGQTGPEPQRIQKAQPVQPGLLIGAQGRPESVGRRHRCDQLGVEQLAGDVFKPGAIGDAEVHARMFVCRAVWLGRAARPALPAASVLHPPTACAPARRLRGFAAVWPCPPPPICF